VLDPESRLLLLCARPQLDAPARTVIRALLSHGLDLAAVVAAARCNFIGTLVNKHLTDAAADLLPVATASALVALRTTAALRTLEIMRVQDMLSRDILQAGQIPHVFFKGATLSQEYYGDCYLRQYRDIDVLVAPESMAAVASALLQRGFTLYKPAGLPPQALRGACAFHRVLEMRAPSGVMVELHRLLDKTGLVFSTKECLAAGVEQTMQGTAFSALACTELFVYLCFHHAKHRWSLLHWCADLEAFRRHPQMDEGRVLALASQLGLRSTVEEAWALRADLNSLAMTGLTDSARASSRYLADCLAALKASRAGEVPVAVAERASPHPDFRYPWQASHQYRRRARWARLHPTAWDYHALPLPAHLHWLYYLLKPLRVATSRARRLWNPGT